MTGEVSLVGEVMPIGGVKEKVTAAYRAGIKKVLLPKKNEPDLEEVPEDVRNNMEFVFPEHVTEVLEHALLKE
jgi:ATP-dependent Lon protease